MSQTPAPLSTANRLAFVDLLRGAFIAHMALDHASLMFNAGRAAEELAGEPAPLFSNLAQFLTRFAGVPVAPGFFFMAGFMVAITSSARSSRGVSNHDINRRLWIRGLVLLAADLVIFGVPRATQGFYSFVVLSSVGVAIMLLAVVRRWPSAVLLPIAVGAIVLHPLIDLSGWPLPLRAVLHDTVRTGPLRSLYPIIPWAAVVLSGFLAGRNFMKRGARPAWWLGLAGLSLLAFVLIRVAGHYGNAYPTASWDTMAFWTFAKYPPDLAFLSWSLTWIFVGLAVMHQIARHGTPRILGPLQIYGRVPFFFYIAHFGVLGVAALVVGTKFSLTTTYVIWAVLLILMLWPCAAYYRWKRDRPNFITRYV